MAIEFSAICDVGPVRKENQDRFIASDFDITLSDTVNEKVRLGEGKGDVLMAVADGMGGVVGGAAAAELALETLADDFVEYANTRDTLEVLSGGFEAAHAAVIQEGWDKGCQGMGTTMTAVVVRGAKLYVAHVGDSRAYLHRRGELVALTTDHSYWTKLRGYDDDAARGMVGGNILAQCVGGSADEVLVELSTIDLRLGDRLLLCTDGLHGVVKKEDIQKRLGEGGPSWAVNGLHMAALGAGTQDNVTVLAARFVDTDLPQSVEGELVRVNTVAEVIYDPAQNRLIYRR